MIHALTSRPELILAVILVPALAAVVVLVIGRYAPVRSRVAWWLAASVSGWVLVLSLYPTGEGGGALSGSFNACVAELQRPGTYGFGSEIRANILMYLLLAMTWTWATYRPLAVTGAAIGLSAVIELTQSVIGHSCSGQDLTANALGAVAGSLVGMITMKRARAPLAERMESSSR